jgi:membrane-bound lytic murein transglycosylase D
VKDGETLDQIAVSLHAHATEIATLNDVTAAKPIESGDELIVPVAAVASAEPGQQRYTLRAHDSLITVADRFGVTVEQLRRWNNLSSTHVTPGRSLYVVEPIRLAPGVHGTRGRHAHSAAHASKGVVARKGAHASAVHATGTAHATQPAKKSATKSATKKRPH